MLYDITTYRIVRQKMGDNQYIERHTHNNYFHYSYVLSGSGRVVVDGHEIAVSKYDMMLAPPGIPHEIYGAKNMIKLDIKFVCGEPLFSHLMQCGYYIRGLTKYEDTLIRDIFEEAVNERPLFAQAIDTKLLEFLYHVVRRERHGIEMVSVQEESRNVLPGGHDRDNEKIRPALDYIAANLDKNFSIAELAEHMGYSENYFSAMFKQYTGYAPTKYINILKIEKAKELILYTSDSITQISEELGFENVHYFSKVFKQVAGLSPTNYIDRSKINMMINVIKDNPLLPSEGQYEIQIKNLSKLP